MLSLNPIKCRSEPHTKNTILGPSDRQKLKCLKMSKVSKYLKQQKFTHCWWKCKCVQLLWEIIWHYCRRVYCIYAYPTILSTYIQFSSSKLQQETCIVSHNNIFCNREEKGNQSLQSYQQKSRQIGKFLINKMLQKQYQQQEINNYRYAHQHR